jgi:hypothetical protein
MSKTKTKKLATVDQQLKKLDDEARKILFENPAGGLSGVEESQRLKFPREVKIVQQLTGDKWFKSPDTINVRKNWGKLFIEPDIEKDENDEWQLTRKVTQEDLQEKMEFTLLNVEFGVEIYKKEKQEGLDFPVRNVYCRSNDTISPAEREDWYASHNPTQDKDGYHYQNQVRLIMTPYSYEEVLEKFEQDENPFVTVTLSGGNGWSTWNYINQEMTKIKKNLHIKGKLSDVLSSLFKITLSAKEDGKYYILRADVGLNDMQEAMRFEDLVNRLEQEFSFFFNTDDMDSNLRDTFPQEENEEVVDVEVEEEEISEEDLPF